MANEWIQSDGRACYNTASPGFPLVQQNDLIPGDYYFIKISVQGMSQGKLILQGLENSPEITEDGDYEFIRKAIYTDIIIYPATYMGVVFNGCIDNIEASRVPTYTIKSVVDDSIVYTMNSSAGITADRLYIQFELDWAELPAGCYYIELEDGPLIYKSECFSLAESHTCTIVIDWNNDQDAFGFDFSGLSFNPQLRLSGKTRNRSYPTKDKNVFDFSNGRAKITNVRITPEIEVAIHEAPEYIHDAISIALNSDSVALNDRDIVYEEDEYTPVWRNTSNLAPAVFRVRQIDDDLLNSNC